MDSIVIKGRTEAYYLFGSASLIDFIAVINRKLSETEVNILKEIHDAKEGLYHKMYLLQNGLADAMK